MELLPVNFHIMEVTIWWSCRLTFSRMEFIKPPTFKKKKPLKSTLFFLFLLCDHDANCYFLSDTNFACLSEIGDTDNEEESSRCLCAIL